MGCTAFKPFSVGSAWAMLRGADRKLDKGKTRPLRVEHLSGGQLVQVLVSLYILRFRAKTSDTMPQSSQARALRSEHQADIIWEKLTKF